MDICNCMITEAELEVMNVLWEKKQATSREVSDILEEKNGWKNTTVKTLLSRLVEKGALETKKESNYFIYFPSVTQTAALTQLSRGFSESICSKSMGSVIYQLIVDNDLSSQDIDNLIRLLERKPANNAITCNCIPK